MLLCYWPVIAIPVAVYFFVWAAGKQKHTCDRAMILAFFIVYASYVCFRATSVGVDTGHYTQFFGDVSVYGWNYLSLGNRSELGFQIFSIIVSQFGNVELFFIVAGLCSVLPIAFLYYRTSESGPLCCSFFLVSLLFEFFFSGVRQGLAIGIGVIAFLFAKKRKFLLFLVAVPLASTMHKSAVVLLILYPLYHARITQKWIPIVAVALVGIYVFRDSIFNTVLMPLFGGDYLDGYEYLTGLSGQGSLSILFLFFAFYSCIILDPKKADAETLGLRNILLLAAVIHIFTPLNPVVCRMNYYFILFIPLALARVNARAKPLLKPVEQVVSFVLPIFFVVYFLFMKGDSLLIAPYEPFFL